MIPQTARFVARSCAALALTAALGAAEPDERARTLEDIYGDTGNTFQAAIGFIAFEGKQLPAQQSYGLAIDDLVVKWKEFTLDPDVTDCAVSGKCALVELDTTNVFQSQTVLAITVLDAVPDAANDCDLDGVTDGTQNCGGSPNPDVVVKAISMAEPAGEIVVCDHVAGGLYRGYVTISTLAGGPGTLFITQQGAELPAVTVTYLDNDMDPGAAVVKCPNHVDPAQHGIVQASTTIFLGASCDVTVVDTTTFDNGDGDNFVDTEETVDMQICVLNNCGKVLHHCTGHISSTSPTVDCILDGTIDMGDLADVDIPLCPPDKFRWKMANASRPDVAADFDATFTFTMSCDEIDLLASVQQVSLQLDLELDAGGETPVTWKEGFEGGSLGASKFYAENLDYGIPGNNNVEGLINGEGWRCQYLAALWSGPGAPCRGAVLPPECDWVYTCYPGASLAGANAIYWQVDGLDTGSPDGGRAKTGSYSGYYGVYLTDPAGEFTTPMADVESIATSGIINLGAAPELNWWQQVSLMDDRGLNMPVGRSGDRGVVEYREFNTANNPVGDWTRLEPFQNKYDTQAYDNYFNCMFDPVDDGNDEDDFFDPTDPNRRLGPSSTCYPGFNYSCMGDTDEPFAVDHACNATVPPGPGDAGSLGTGTWVQSKVDLEPLMGRRIKLRFLATALKAYPDETWDAFFDSVNPGDVDNGWWIDDVTISETLTSPATLVVDQHTLHHCVANPAIGCLDAQECLDSGFPGPCQGAAPPCPPTCTSLTVVVSTAPDENGGSHDEALAAPGQAITLDASASFGTCLDGVLQFRFSKDSGATLIREYSEDPVLIDVPDYPSEAYVVEVRCSTEKTCTDSETVTVTVDCPDGQGDDSGPIFHNVRADCDAGPVDTAPCSIPDATATWFWAASVPFEYCKLNNKAALLAYTCSIHQTGLSGSSFVEAPALPPSGVISFYLFKGDGTFCNVGGSWSEGGNEAPGRDQNLP